MDESAGTRRDGRDASDASGPGTRDPLLPDAGPVPRAERRLAVAAGARAVLITAGLLTAYYLLPLTGRLTGGTAALLGCGLAAVLLVFSWELRVIARSPHPRLRAVEALAATVSLFLVLFAGAYLLLDRSAPGAFSEPLTRTDALYFALSTFTTVGFGDIVAHARAARLVTMLQMVGGLLLVGVAARVLAGAVETGLRRRSRRPPGGAAASPARGEAAPPSRGEDGGQEVRT
ncbi:potassium channel family protein [Streptomyces minutiscleroticus]|nr:potassium channel family protein [Streptomyces minutiscleroticus]